MEWLFDQGCPVVVLACNTASARALRTLQQKHLPEHRPDRSLLGVVRPSAEALAGLPPGAIPGVTRPGLASGIVAVLGTEGTVSSDSYRLELEKLAPGLQVVQQACPLWVPLVESGEIEGPGVEWFLHRYLDPLFGDGKDPTKLLLACTHYPLLYNGIRRIVPDSCEVLSQAELVAQRLEDWLRRHPEMDEKVSKTGARRFATTDDAEWFSKRGQFFLGETFEAQAIRLPGVGS